MNDYLDQKNNLDALYNRFPNLETLKSRSLKNKIISTIAADPF
jgi:hypothetical protein